jgi:hypothetical protein
MAKGVNHKNKKDGRIGKLCYGLRITFRDGSKALKLGITKDMKSRLYQLMRYHGRETQIEEIYTNWFSKNATTYEDEWKAKFGNKIPKVPTAGGKMKGATEYWPLSQEEVLLNHLKGLKKLK